MACSDSIVKFYKEYKASGGKITPMNTETCRKYLEEKLGKYVRHEDVLWLFYNVK